MHAFWREPLRDTIYFTTSVFVFLAYLKWRIRNKPDILHTHGHLAIWIFLYRFILGKIFKNAGELKIPLVVHFHNTVAGRKAALEEKGATPKALSKYLGWPLAELSDRLAAEIADALIFVSTDNLDEAVKYYRADRNKSYIVESGVNTSLFKPVGAEEKEKTREDLSFEMHEKIILNHGIMSERKNIHLLVEALKLLPEQYRLFLAGPFDSKEYQKKINEMISENELQNRVTMTGYVPYPHTPIAYQACDLFVLPSSFEGLPKVVVQSLACGVPALASGFKLSENISGLFYLNDLKPETVANQIQEVAGSQVSVDFGKVHHLYSWENRVKEIEEVYDKVLGPIN